jgi:tRNA (mo5U34)-methyltransferase
VFQLCQLYRFQMKNPYAQLALDGRAALAELGWKRLEACNHGDLDTWLSAISTMPPGDGFVQLDQDAPALGSALPASKELHDTLMALHPWRKGPLELGGQRIDTEWRSDWKWQRIAPHLELENHEVLDIGSGNGYFGLRMLAAGARQVVGIDPTIVFVMQWLAMQKFAPCLKNYVLPVGIEAVPVDTGGFDSVFSMGVLYHRREPVEHLERLRKLVKPGGQVVLETLVLEGDGHHVLKPQGRYARMRNVHAVPSLAVLFDWMGQAGLHGARMLDVSKTTTEEQRSTPWMRFESLAECLDQHYPGRTVEGHPAPVRAALLVTT